MPGTPRHLRLVALVALAVVVVAIIAILSAGRGPSGVRASATLESANGLIAGADVRNGGVAIGRVTSVDLGPGDRPVVRFRLQDGLRMREGARLDLRLASQAGQLNRYLELSQGTGRELPDGAHLGRGSTDQPVELDDALSTLSPPVRADVRHLARALDATLKDQGPGLERTLRHADRALRQTAGLLSDAAGDGRALRSLVRDGATVTRALASDPSSLQAVADRLAGTLEVTAARRGDIGTTVEELAPALRPARGALDTFTGAIPGLRALARTAAPAAREARRVAPDLAAALKSAPRTLAAARDLAVQAPARMRTVRPLLRESLPVLRKVPSALRQFAPLLDELRARAPDALGWLPLLGDALANYDANGHGARLAVILTESPKNEVGPGDDAAGMLARPFDRVPGVLEGEPWLDYRDTFVGDRPAPIPTEDRP